MFVEKVIYTNWDDLGEVEHCLIHIMCDLSEVVKT